MSDQPRRIQLEHAPGWQMPDNTVKVDRSTKWANPYGATLSRAWAVDAYRLAVRDVTAGLTGSPVIPNADEIRAELAGKNLACWCPTGTPCHADVLIEIANRPETA